MRNPCAPVVLSILVLAGAFSGRSASAQEGAFQFWTQLSASDAAASRWFGSDVRLSSDGSTALVAAGCQPATSCSPAAYVFVRDQGAWSEQARLEAPGSPPLTRTLTIALSGDGDTALLGIFTAPCPGGGNSCGVAYVYTRYGTEWRLQQTLRPADIQPTDNFGSGVALSGDGSLALIGAHAADCPEFSSCGAAYVFTRTGGFWTEGQKLRGIHEAASFFGSSISMSLDGNSALIAGGFDLGLVFAGRIHFFTRSGGVWTFQSLLTAPDSGAELVGIASLSGDGFTALAQEDNLHGGPVIVYTRTGNTWSSGTVLAGPTFGGELRSFQLSDDGQTALVVTSPSVCSPGVSCGTAEIFRRNGSAWTRVQGFSVPGSGGNYALRSSALSGDTNTVLLGAPEVPCSAGSQCGAVYAFTSAPLAVGIPTLGEAGLAALTLALSLSALILLRRHRKI
jgi:hypothetical protein